MQNLGDLFNNLNRRLGHDALQLLTLKPVHHKGVYVLEANFKWNNPSPFSTRRQAHLLLARALRDVGVFDCVRRPDKNGSWHYSVCRPDWRIACELDVKEVDDLLQNDKVKIFRS